MSENEASSPVEAAIASGRVFVDFEEVGSPEQVTALYAALAEAMESFTRIEKNREVTIRPKDKQAYSFKYAELEESIAATRPALKAHGLGVIQPYTGAPGNPDLVRTILFHKDGARIVTLTELPSWNDIKALGANITYVRRYAYNALLCLAADSDADEGPSQKEETGRGAGRPSREPEVPPAGKATTVRAPSSNASEPKGGNSQTQTGGARERPTTSGVPSGSGAGSTQAAPATASAGTASAPSGSGERHLANANDSASSQTRTPTSQQPQTEKTPSTAASNSSTSSPDEQDRPLNSDEKQLLTRLFVDAGVNQPEAMLELGRQLAGTEGKMQTSHVRKVAVGLLVRIWGERADVNGSMVAGLLPAGVPTEATVAQAVGMLQARAQKIATGA